MSGFKDINHLKSLDIVLVDSCRLNDVTLSYPDKTSADTPAVIVAQDLASGLYLTWGLGREKLDLLANAYNKIVKTKGRIGLYSDRQSGLISGLFDKGRLDQPMIELRRVAGEISKGIWSPEDLLRKLDTHFQILNESTDGECSPKQLFEKRKR